MTIPESEIMPFFTELAACRPICGTPGAEDALELSAARFREAGANVELVAMPSAPVLWARHTPSAPAARLGWLGHVDATAAAANASWAPRVEGDRLYCPTAADMNGAVAAMRRIMYEIVAQDRVAVDLVVVCDEESSEADLSFPQFAARNLPDCDLWIAGEPTRGGSASHASKSQLAVTVHITGVPGHDAYSHRLVNPLDLWDEFHARLRALDFLEEPSRGVFDTGVLLNRTGCHSGEAYNQIPPVAIAQISIRLMPWQNLPVIKQAIENEATVFNDELHARLRGSRLDLTEEEERVVGVGVELGLTKPGIYVPKDDPILALLCESMRCGVTANMGGTDAGYLPPGTWVVECGLAGDHIHRIDEYTLVGEMARYADGMMRFVYALGKNATDLILRRRRERS